MQRTGIGGRRGAGLTRKDFLRLGGAGLAGAALLGSGTGCGGGGQRAPGTVIFSWAPDDTGILPKLIRSSTSRTRATSRSAPGDALRHGAVLRPAQDRVPGRRRRHRRHQRGRDLAGPVRGQRLRSSTSRTASPTPTSSLPGPIQAHDLRRERLGRPLVHRRGAALLQAGPAREGRLLRGAPRPGRSSRRWPPRRSRTTDLRARASSSREPSTRAGCATAASTSGPTAATCSTPKIPRRSS